MLIKITKFEELYSDSFFETNDGKSILMLHSGRDFFEVCNLLQSVYKKDSLLFKPNVHIPLMHQCIELLVKALVRKVDETVNLKKKYSHNTINLLIDYKDKISVFSTILEDSEKRNLIDELKKAYLELKYGDAHSNFDFEVFVIFNSIAEELMDAYNDLT